MHLLFPLLATGARGAERAVRIWNVQVGGIVDCMEFVTSGTSDTCVKYFWVQVNVQKLTRKITLSMNFAEFRLEFSQNNCYDFVIE